MLSLDLLPRAAFAFAAYAMPRYADVATLIPDCLPYAAAAARAPFTPQRAADTLHPRYHCLPLFRDAFAYIVIV